MSNRRIGQYNFLRYGGYSRLALITFFDTWLWHLFEGNTYFMAAFNRENLISEISLH